ncbi:hypothetical protein G6F31_018159 [Rhizopus arrhizus]|nr:hypothetical protein G6F31_018159 [Rhizopus arrhizus]
MASRPPAPGLFSTTTGWPNALCNRSASGRANRSGRLPGPPLPTMVIGRAGHSAALAGTAAANAAQAARPPQARRNHERQNPAPRADCARPARGDAARDSFRHGRLSLGRITACLLVHLPPAKSQGMAAGSLAALFFYDKQHKSRRQYLLSRFWKIGLNHPSPAPAAATGGRSPGQPPPKALNRLARAIWRWVLTSI